MSQLKSSGQFVLLTSSEDYSTYAGICNATTMPLDKRPISWTHFPTPLRYPALVTTIGTGKDSGGSISVEFEHIYVYRNDLDILSKVEMVEEEKAENKIVLI